MKQANPYCFGLTDSFVFDTSCVKYFFLKSGGFKAESKARFKILEPLRKNFTVPLESVTIITGLNIIVIIKV